MADAAAPDTAPLTGAEDVRWDLSDLYASAEALTAALEADEAAAAAFAGRYRGRLAALDAAAFAAMLRELEGLSDRLGRAYTYAYLDWSTDTEDAARGALLQKVREAYTRAGQDLLFVDVEWAALDDARATALLADDALAPFRHHLELKRAAREHVLTEPEEHVLAEKAVTGWSAWNRFFDEALGAARFEYRGEALPLQQVMAKLHDADRAARADAAASITEGLGPLRRPLTYVFNTILADKASNDRLRKYAHWLDARNESNEIEAASVDALVEAVTGRYDLVARFYTASRRGSSGSTS
jgi:oligoendopeptidase F